MNNKDFSFSSLFKHALAYFQAIVKAQILKAGKLTNSLIKKAVVVAVLLLAVPLFFTLLFVALGFGFQHWFQFGYGLSFLLSATALIVVSFLLIVIGIAATRSHRAAILEKVMNQVNKLQAPPESYFSEPTTIWSSNDGVDKTYTPSDNINGNSFGQQ